MPKQYLKTNVLEEAIKRINYIFDNFKNIYLSVSGGKDSTAMFYLAYQIAKDRGCLPLNVLFIDWEAQYKLTIENITTIMTLPGINPYWICLPLTTDNASSFFEPVWTSWDPSKKDVWVRPYPEFDFIIKDYDYFDFYRFAMSFEDFVYEFGDWFTIKHNANKVVCVMGIRASESYSRYLGIRAKKNKIKFGGNNWINRMKKNKENVYNAFPIYDWCVTDVWKYIGINNLPYNKVYDLMYRHGRSIYDMRVCEPFGFEARKGIKYYQEIEPDTWDKMVLRTDGLNTGSIYGTEYSVYGYLNKIELPSQYKTWKEYVQFLLSTLPSHIKAHYERRINVFVEWFKKNLGWKDLKDIDEIKKESNKKGGSWRMVAKAIIKNDLFCESLCFQVNKDEFKKIKEGLNDGS